MDRGGAATDELQTPRRSYLLLAFPDPRARNPCSMTLTLRRFLVLALSAAFVCVPVLSAGAATNDDLAAARQKLADARQAANDTAAAFSESDHKLEETREHIAQLKSTIADTKARAAELRAYARQRAVFAYTHPGNSLETLMDADGTVDAIRKQQLLDQANQTDNDVVKKLAAVNAQLKNQQADLERQEREQQEIADQLDAKLASLQAKQAEVEQAVADLQARLDAEIAAAAAADAARKAQLEAERAALRAQQTVSTGGAGQIVAAPGPRRLPVPGARGRVQRRLRRAERSPRHRHDGADGHAGDRGEGRASVTFAPNEGAGGNAAYLAADDGNTYYYAHFSQYVGGAEDRRQGRDHRAHRHDRQRQRAAPPLRDPPRGPNGNRTDPYPTLKAAGC